MTHRSLERGLHVLEVIAASGGLISLAEIARRTGLHRSTGHHLLQTLVGAGYLRQDARDALLRALRQAVPAHRPDLDAGAARRDRATARRRARARQRRGCEPCGLSRRRREDRREMRSRRPGAGGAGRRRRAADPRDRGRQGDRRVPAGGGARRRALADAYERYTPRTIVQRRALEAELRRIRAAGCANDDEEHIEGIRCVAAPVRIYSGQVVASLCTVGPKSRMTRAAPARPARAAARARRHGLGAARREPGRRGAARRRLNSATKAMKNCDI